jgi:hypothetical protein
MNDVQGFGIGDLQDVQSINKALEGAENTGLNAGAAFGSSNYGTTGAQSLRVESLDSSLKVITFTDKHINFWKDIPKSPAYSTVEEFNQLTSYGTQAGGFLTEGELPYASNSDYARRAALVKFIGTTRSVSHPLTLVRTMVPDVIAQENSNGIMWMLRQIENSLFWGTDVSRNSAENVEWAGMDELIGGGPRTGGTGAGNTYDLRGATLSSTPFTHLVNDLAQTVVDNFGFPTDIYIPFPVLAKINEEFAGTAAQRVILPTASGNTQVNINIDGLMTQAGRVNLKPTFFLQKTRLMPTAAVQQTGAPSTGVLANAGTNAVTHAGSPATGYTLPLGWYSVGYNFENKYGQTIGIAATTTPEVQCDDVAVSLTMTIGTTPAAATHVNMYISEVQTSEALALAEAVAGRLYWVQKFPLLVGDGAYVYNCKRLPNTYTAFIGQMTPDVLTFRQLAPLVKMDLATIAPAYKWMILLYGVPVIFAPLKWTRVINIKY